MEQTDKDLMTARAAAPFAPADLVHLSSELIEERLNDEEDEVRAIIDDREHEMAEQELVQRWDAYLNAWHQAWDH